MKAVGVKSVVHTELQALLAHSAGYNFRNKLVSYDELKAIFTDMSAFESLLYKN